MAKKPETPRGEPWPYGRFWHTANLAFNPGERSDFNRWRLDLFLLAERVVEEARDVDVRRDDGRRALERANLLIDAISRIPVLAE